MLSNYFGIAGIIVIDYIAFRAVFKNLLFDFIKVSKKLKTGQLVKGTIVGFESKVDLDQRTQYAPIVSYINENDGIEYKVKSDDFKLTRAPLNSIVNVCYEPESPSDAIVNPQSVLTFKAFLMIFVFLVMAAINIGILYKLSFL